MKKDKETKKPKVQIEDQTQKTMLEPTERTLRETTTSIKERSPVNEEMK